jgi:hypothetical protein
MISRSEGHCGKLRLLSRVAGRSTPMTGTDRSKLSYLTFLFLLVLLGMPKVARTATLEDSARELAGKIAASLPTGVSVSFEILNISSLQLDEFSKIEQAFKADLQNKGVRTETSRSARVSVVVTLSENVKSFVWTAEIHYGDTSSVVLTTVPRPRESRVVAMPISLRSEKFWEGPQTILDAMIVNSSSGGSLLLLLTPVSLLIRKIGSDELSVVQIPATEFMTRDPAGDMTQFENKVTVRFQGQICNIDLDVRTLTECHAPEGRSAPPPGRVFGDPKFAVLGPLPDYQSGQIAPVELSCRTGPVYVLSGSGDYTKQDTVRLFESAVTGGIVAQNPLSDTLHFAGPVMALIPNGTTPRAIVRNLETGNYEAYRFSITCAQ